MDLRKKFLNKVKSTFGKKSSVSTGRPLKNDTSVSPVYQRSFGVPYIDAKVQTSDVLISRPAGQPLGIRTHASRPDSPESPENAEVDKLGALDLENVDGQHPNGRRNVDTIEKVPEIRNTSPRTSGNRNRHSPAEAKDKDRELMGQLPTDHSSPESMRFHDIKNSGISIGGGPVNVSNVNTGNTTVNGTLIQNNNSSEQIRPGLNHLQMRVATSAFHNSAQRVDPPRCHPNTRVAIQKEIYDWILLDLLARQTWIMWMHGAAGAGKSAIMQSIAEFCELAHIPLASFFFFRTDITRNSMAPFMATIVYQLIQKLPQLRDEICMIIESNPLVFGESLESQLQKLVIQPLVRLQESFKRYFIIMIDGLDECTERAHQSDLIKLLGTVSRSRTTPVLFLVASRREPQIEATFIGKTVSDLVLTLPLDNSDIEQTSDDIRHFLTDKFQDITETHLRRRFIPANWPPAAIVEEIVTKSSGQFIYASVIINYISSPRGNPAHLLEIVHGIRMRDPSSQNPFAHLDALYKYIFSQVEGLDTVLDILAWILITGCSSISRTQETFQLEDGGLEVRLADLTAVIKLENERIHFLHASLPDFLRDQTRSDQYYIDIEEYNSRLLCMFLDRVPPRLDPSAQAHGLDAASRQEYFRVQAIGDHLAHGVKASNRLLQSLMNFRVTFPKNSVEIVLLSYVIGLLEHLKRLDFGDMGQAYNYVLDQFSAEIAKDWSLVVPRAKLLVKNDAPILHAHIDQILYKEL